MESAALKQKKQTIYALGLTAFALAAWTGYRLFGKKIKEMLPKMPEDVVSLDDFKQMLEKILEMTHKAESKAYIESRKKRRSAKSLKEYVSAYKNFRSSVADMKHKILDEVLDEFKLTSEEWEKAYKYHTTENAAEIEEIIKRWHKPMYYCVEATKDINKPTLIKILEVQTEYIKQNLGTLQEFKSYVDTRLDWVVLAQNKLYDHTAELFSIELEDVEETFPDLGAAYLMEDNLYTTTREKFNTFFMLIFEKDDK